MNFDRLEKRNKCFPSHTHKTKVEWIYTQFTYWPVFCFCFIFRANDDAVPANTSLKKNQFLIYFLLFLFEDLNYISIRWKKKIAQNSGKKNILLHTYKQKAIYYRTKWNKCQFTYFLFLSMSSFVNFFCVCRITHRSNFLNCSRFIQTIDGLWIKCIYLYSVHIRALFEFNGCYVSHLCIHIYVYVSVWANYALVSHSIPRMNSFSQWDSWFLLISWHSIKFIQCIHNIFLCKFNCLAFRFNCSEVQAICIVMSQKWRISSENAKENIWMSNTTMLH